MSPFYKILRWLVSFRVNQTYVNNHKQELLRFCKTAGVSLTKRDGESEYINKWSKIYPNVNIDFYRFYSNFIGEDVNIVSDDIYHIIIEPILNDQSSISVYGNKNYYELLMKPEIFPVCVIRNISGDYMDRDYQIITMNESEFMNRVTKNPRLKELGRFICKPTTDTCGGNGVHLFTITKSGEWISDEGAILSLALIEKMYGKDFIIQECITPSAFVRQFNETSFSTFRIITYRSIKDDEVHFIGCYMRVGAKGSFKDNVCGGGYACPILPDGRLSNFATDVQSKRYNNINGISLSKDFIIPNFEKILGLTNYLAKRNVPNRILSFDIILDDNNEPHVIEINIKDQTVREVQTSGKPFFGQFTDEIIEYCSKNMNKISYHLNL